MKRVVLIVGINLTVVCACLAAADVYLARKGFQPYVRTFPQSDHAGVGVPWARFDPSLGWTIDPAYLPDQINPQGFRDTKDFERSPRQPGRLRVMVLGDSFVVGAHLNPEQTLPGLLQARLGDRYEVFSAAVPGWGVDQMYLAYQRYKAVLTPDILVVVFIDDDVKRVLEAYRVPERLAKPALTVKGESVVPREPPSSRRLWINRQLGRNIFTGLLTREFYLATDARDIVGRIFRAIAEDVSARNGRAFALRVPTRDDGEWLNRFRRWRANWGASFAGTRGVYLDAGATTLSWGAELYVADGHLTARGTEQLTEYLLRAVRAD